jgi:hypothetical protein
VKQILLHKGRIQVEDVPAPARRSNGLLVEVTYSLISTGTELSTIQTNKERPQQVGKVIDSLRVRGVRKTLDLIQEKLDGLEPLGYSCVERIININKKVKNFINR